MKNKKNIIDIVNNKNQIIRVIAFIFGVLLVAINYNLILSPNGLVIGGTSGLALVVEATTGLSKIAFLNISTGILLIASLIFLGKKKTIKSLFGAIIFNSLIALTSPLANVITINFKSTFMIVILSAILNGVATGIIYKSGFNNGGSDILITIIHKYSKITMGKSSTIVNIVIIGLGLLVFGPIKTFYAAFILIMSNYMVDFILLGIKDSKMCFIKSEKMEEISKYIIKNMNLGITEVNSKGGILTKTEPVIIVIVPTEQYYGFKYLIKEKDNKAFLLTLNCYGVSGGYKKSFFAF